MAEEFRFEVLPAGEMRQKYVLYAKNRPVIELNPANVPAPLRHLIPFVEVFGVSDDLIRLDLVANTPRADLEQLRQVIEENGHLLDEWLAGPAVEGPSFSDEYVAFSCMRMAADGC